MLVRAIRSSLKQRGFHSAHGVVWSGHNKWSTIKHDKAKNDANRNKIINKCANQIALSIKLGGGSTDPALNMRLNAAITSALKNNVTKRVIENAIKKGSGASGDSGNNLESCTYEIMGPGGVAMVVEAATDNKNRTIGFVRSLTNKANASMSPTLYMFDARGRIVVEPPAHLLGNDEGVLESILELDDIVDVNKNEEDEETSKDDTTTSSEDNAPEKYTVITEPTDTNTVSSNLQKLGFNLQDVRIVQVAQEATQIDPSEETFEKIKRFVDQLQDIDEITDIYTNIRGCPFSP
ncbi:hypothetical protein TBLA_0G00590 [Henningerozyma blattae CBS 6284]|uniref:Transcriptional regulatory protein n=1 Tax=Henningerozyma blattae (strain ATCC 34711 / CBS 6284 / DSM 70876 / NBRC 10599 / NRRL Y-10934 / UCD 77-7) TaxID=1071380 RepID=I2H6K6_HENB6|nr:hypothetical protein TBLA_0G00590 [Tetrapisispora blattae CBS 6284]CCH62008.1 hypothetical protein TBLA_0G00590 [Tetrapisispora blattae CBS 6284]